MRLNFTIIILALLFLQTNIFLYAQPLTIDQPPKIELLPKFTTEESIKIKGKTLPLCTVVISGGSTVSQGLSDSHGNFEIGVFLNLGQENRLRIYCEYFGDRTPTTEVTIIQIKGAKVNITDEPIVQKEDIPKYTKDLEVVIKGIAPPLTVVTVIGGTSESSAFADANGNFEAKVFLKPDLINRLTIRAEDKDGFVTPPSIVEVVQILTPPPAPRVGKVISPTNINVQQIYGISRPGTTVVIKGGMYPVFADSDARGNFLATVSLRENTPNILSLSARDLAGNVSPDVETIIIHDSISPPPPIVKEYPRETVKLLAKVKGETESRTEIIFEGNALTKTDSFGDFEIDVPIKRYIRQKRVNEITLSSRDSAGNTSLPSIIKISHLPDIKRSAVEVSVGIHTFLPSEFFSKNREKFGISSFIGPSAEISYDFLFFRSTGPSLGITFGGNTSFKREIRFPALEAGEVGCQLEIEKCKTMILNTVYAFLEPKITALTEWFDFYISGGAGVMLLQKEAPEWNKVINIIEVDKGNFYTFAIKGSIGFRYFIREYLSLHIKSSYLTAKVKKVNEEGHEIDAGGIIVGGGLGFHF